MARRISGSASKQTGFWLSTVLMLAIGAPGCGSSAEDGSPEAPGGSIESEGSVEAPIPITIATINEQGMVFGSYHGKVKADGTSYYQILIESAGNHRFHVYANTDANLWFEVTSVVPDFYLECGRQEAACSPSALSCGSGQRSCMARVEANATYTIAVHNVDRMSRGSDYKYIKDSIGTEFSIIVTAENGRGTVDNPAPLTIGVPLDARDRVFHNTYYSFTAGDVADYSIAVTNIVEPTVYGYDVVVTSPESDYQVVCERALEETCPITVEPGAAYVIAVKLNGNEGGAIDTFGYTLQVTAQ